MLLPIILIALLLAIGLIVGQSVRLGISPMPTSLRAQQAVGTLLPDIVDGPIYELGAGWGGMLIFLANKYPTQKIIGVERSLLPYLVTKVRLYLNRNPNVDCFLEDYRSVDISGAGLIYCYLFVQGMADLEPKFTDECPLGCVFLSNTFQIPGWEPETSVQLKDLYRSQVYLYRK